MFLADCLISRSKFLIAARLLTKQIPLTSFSIKETISLDASTLALWLGSRQTIVRSALLAPLLSIKCSRFGRSSLPVKRSAIEAGLPIDALLNTNCKTSELPPTLSTASLRRRIKFVKCPPKLPR